MEFAIFSSFYLVEPFRRESQRFRGSSEFPETPAADIADVRQRATRESAIPIFTDRPRLAPT